MDDRDDNPDNLVKVNFGDIAIKPRQYRGPAAFCEHSSVVVDEDTHTVECRACHCTIDAFRVLLDYARKERRFRHYEQEIKEAGKRLCELLDEEKRVKARLRNAREAIKKIERREDTR